MKYYAGIDVSLKESSVCVVDATGKLVREVKVGSEPECLVGYFDQLDFPVERIGLEAGPLSQRLHAALVAAGHEVVLLETRHVKAALSAMTVKTDRKDARGIAQLLRMGWYRPVHAKSSVQARQAFQAGCPRRLVPPSAGNGRRPNSICRIAHACRARGNPPKGHAACHSYITDCHARVALYAHVRWVTAPQ